MQSLSKVFGRAVRRRRAERGLSQEELAGLSGIHRTYVSAIERGKVRLGLDVALRVANSLRVPLSELIADAEELLEPRDG